MVQSGYKKQRSRLTPGKRMVVILLIVSVLVGAGSAGYRYLADYYPATITAKLSMATDERVTVEEEEEYYRFSEGGQISDRGIIFYPGGKVDETAYAPMLRSFVLSGFDVYLMRMPFHLAVFKKNAADLVIGEGEKEWILMGHSLGGSMAADYAAGHAKEVDGLVLLGAYSTKDLSETGIRVLSIYGDRDQIMNLKRYEDNRKNLPEGTLEHVIEGGNHSGYGYYGIQEGDGEAEITPEEQQEDVVDLVMNYFVYI